MTDQLISRADLSTIERSLSGIHNGLGALASDQERIAAEVRALRAEFASFVQDDARQKQLHLAETRLVKVRQELEERFGFHAEVRRRATGILQALDAGLVSHQSVQDATEDMMISVPGYWLAPALVAMAAWIRDERPLAGKALSEALRRDDYKTSLYFALVLRRYERRTAAATWLARFYAHQDPTALDREFVVLLDAVAGGIFGAEARAVTSRHTAEWLADLALKPGFVPEQERRWARGIEALTPTVLPTAYPTLQKYSPTWGALQSSILSSYLHARVKGYFDAIFTGELTPSPRLAEDADRLLARLVTEYDDAELPFRRKERELELIIEENGQVQAAQKRASAEVEAFDEKSDFTALLTSAALHPEVSKAGKATQRYAVALSRDWVVAAYDQVTARARAAVPAEIAVEVNGWRGTLRDGSEEAALVASMAAAFAAREEAELKAADRSAMAKVLMALGAFLVLYGVFTGFGALALVVGIALAAMGGIQMHNQGPAMQRVRDAWAGHRREGERIVKAAAAEYVDARAELRREDALAETTRAALLAISPEQHTMTRDSGRAVVA